MAGLAGNTRGLNPLLKLKNVSHLYTFVHRVCDRSLPCFSSKPEGIRQLRIHVGGGRYRPDAFFAILPGLSVLRGRVIPS